MSETVYEDKIRLSEQVASEQAALSIVTPQANTHPVSRDLAAANLPSEICALRSAFDESLLIEHQYAEIYLRHSHAEANYYRLVTAMRRLDYAQDVLFYSMFVFLLSIVALSTVISCMQFTQVHPLIQFIKQFTGLFGYTGPITERMIMRILGSLAAIVAPFAMVLPPLLVLMRSSTSQSRPFKPTHLVLSEEGMRDVRLGLYSLPESSGRWTDLTAIRHLKPKRKGKTPKLVFEFGPLKRVVIDLHAFTDEHEIAVLFKVCRAKISDPDLLRQLDEVAMLMQPEKEKTYTELWSKSLLNSPDRLRLSVLPPDVRLQDGRYRVVKQLGAGGQGTAYLAEDTRESCLIVLKEYILPDSNNIQDKRRAITRLEDESRLLAKLTHNQIVKAIDVFLEDHRAYLVLEHIDGPPLKNLIAENGAMDQKQAIELALQMCSVLEYLHGLTPPMVHQDFTPDNLLLTDSHVLKLVDFNVAREKQSTKTALVVGKHAYMPPEQFKGKACPQSDIYAMGATLQYLLTGSEPEPLSCCHPAQKAAVSEELDRIVAKATELDLSDRYKSVSEMREDLERLKIGEETT